MKLLLDTSTFLWFISADPRLPQRVVAEVRSPGNEAWLSVVSFWEILVKHRLGRLPLPAPPSVYIPGQRARHRIESLPLEESAVVHLVKLPLLHRDPFDRMLICQAIEHESTLVTDDQKIRAYPIRTYWES